ncbi:hypothetical protein [Bradyrhizobium stylosanthis]|uniref:hypothetical protein n=1 Tax=Bradyrhizobium stylosanthis TaxID=1803665 RepID=UPI0007C476E4|nr:hypothetical protein [Bradyrhizobium stylosanthis]
MKTLKIILAASTLLVGITAASAAEFTQAQIDAAAKASTIEPKSGSEAWCQGEKSNIRYWKSLADDGLAKHAQRLQREMKTYTDMGCSAFDK